MSTNGSIPLKRFGKTDVQISALGLGGHHLGAAKDEQEAVAIVHARDGWRRHFFRQLLGV